MFESPFASTTYTSALAACALVFATYLHQPNQQSRLNNQWLGRVQLNQQTPLLKQLKGLGLDLALEQHNIDNNHRILEHLLLELGLSVTTPALHTSQCA